MKHLLNGVAVVAALMVAGPVWAQNPSGGNPMGMPGPSPGGPGLTPYSGGGAAPPPAAAGPAPGASTSAAPPVHRPMHPVHHAQVMRHFHKGMAARAAKGGDTTAQLNREELARIHSGDLGSPPPAAPMGGPPEEPSGRMPGPKTSGSSGAGPR